MNPSAHAPGKIAVLASGNGSNLQAILDRVAAGQLEVRVAVLISDVESAPALQRAVAAGVPTHVVAPCEYPDRSTWNLALARALQGAEVELVVLAGFMRIVGHEVLEAFPGRILNIHPSLLPRYRGLNTYQRVLEAGERTHGTSVHFVTAELDGGPIIAQARIDISSDDDEDSLRRRVQSAEHWLYPEVIGWHAAGRLEMRDEAVFLDGRLLEKPVVFSESGPG